MSCCRSYTAVLTSLRTPSSCGSTWPLSWTSILSGSSVLTLGLVSRWLSSLHLVETRNGHAACSHRIDVSRCEMLSSSALRPL
jgi:hypothetical protein